MPIVNFFNFDVITQPDPADATKTITQHTPGPNSLYSGGVVLNLVIGVDAVTEQALLTANLPVPQPVVVKALFDTGCTITSVDKSVIDRLNLKTIGFANTGTANGAVIVSQHTISIAFPGTGLTGKSLHVIQSVDLSGQPISALIGRDLMASWHITYNGPGGFVSISD